MEPILQTIAQKVMVNWNKEQYRKIETINEIKQAGKCPVCGTPVSEGEKFCGCCGEKLR